MYGAVIVDRARGVTWRGLTLMLAVMCAVCLVVGSEGVVLRGTSLLGRTLRGRCAEQCFPLLLLRRIVVMGFGCVLCFFVLPERAVVCFGGCGGEADPFCSLLGSARPGGRCARCLVLLSKVQAQEGVFSMLVPGCARNGCSRRWCGCRCGVSVLGRMATDSSRRGRVYEYM